MKHNPEDGDYQVYTFLRSNPHPMWIYDHQTLRFLEVNPAAITKYGYSRARFLKMKITEIRPKDQIPQLLAGIRPFHLNGAYIGRCQHLTKGGRLIDVEITASQLFFNARPAVLVEAQDITERKRSEESARALAVVEERNRIAREIHDVLAQTFTGVIVQLEAAQDVIRKQPAEANKHIRRARTLASKSLAEVRQSVWEIYPAAIQKQKLVTALLRMVEQAKRDGFPVQFSIKGEPRALSTEVETNLLRITQEALTNTIRHAHATEIRIRLSFLARNVTLVLKDNGCGFDPTCNSTGFGLISIRDRARQLGAELIGQYSAMKQVIRILVADDHPIVRQGLIALINRCAGMRVVAEADDGKSTVSQFHAHHPDICLIDLRMPKMDGVEAIRHILQKDLSAKIIVLTTFDDEEDIYRALKYGAEAYILKDISKQKLLDVVRTVYEGGSYIPHEMGQKFVSRVRNSDLTLREVEVLRLLVDGKSNKEIANDLHVQEGTVKIHVNHILRKLGASARTEAATTAIKRGIIQL